MIVESAASIAKERESGQFMKIKLNRKCPKCGNIGMQRAADSVGPEFRAMVMPIYTCSSCSTKGYHLTEPYLKFLLEKQKELLSEKEKEEMMANEAAFIKEIKAYIIRIFASKKIDCIE
jgi:hypothetical protein